MSSYFWGKSPSSAKCESQNSEDRPENEPETNVTSGEIGSCVKDDYVKPDSDLKKEVEGIVDDVRDVGEDKDENGEEKVTEKEELSEEEDASDDDDASDDEEEVEEESQGRPRRDYEIDQNKPMWVISADGRPIFYTDSEEKADKILWSAAKRCCRNVPRHEYCSVHLTPRSKKVIDITGSLNFVIMSYDQIIHRLTYRRAPFVTINNGKLD